MTRRVFGEIPGYPEGTYFSTRVEASHAGIHRPTQGGISGSSAEGADSIVVSGGYEDDRDFGSEIIYIGHGGRDPETGEQVADQEKTSGNSALMYSCDHDLPVRVLRGANPHSQFAPKAGYRYDGLYKVEEYWQQKGKSGYMIWCFKLMKLQPETAPWKSAPPGHILAKVARLTNSSKSKPTIKKAIPSFRDAKSLKPESEQAPETPKLNIGDKVKHPIFGVGIVLATSPTGMDDQAVTIDFKDKGNKKLLASKANLERIT